MPARSEPLRCPFCHDAITDPLVACGSCGAPHHPECFVEHASCAASMCGHPGARVGPQELTVGELQAVSQDPERLAALAASLEAPTSPLETFAQVFVGLTVPVLLGALGFMVLQEAGAILGVVVGVVVAWSILSGGAPARRIQVRNPQERTQTFDPIFGTWSDTNEIGFLQGAGDHLLTQLKEGGEKLERPQPEGPPPEDCPRCDEALSERDSNLLFCYHCGGDLVDMAGRWLTKESLSEPGPPEEPEQPEESPGPPAREQA